MLCYKKSSVGRGSGEGSNPTLHMVKWRALRGSLFRVDTHTPVYSLLPDKFAFKTLNWKNLSFKTWNVFPVTHVGVQQPSLLEIANKIFPIAVYIHSVLLLFSSHSECWTAGHVDDVLAPLPSWPLRPPSTSSFSSPGKIIPGPWSLCSQVLSCHPLISIVLLLWISHWRPSRTVAPSCKKCSNERSQSPGVPSPPLGLAYFPHWGSSLLGRTPATIQAVGRLVGHLTSWAHKINLGKWVGGWLHAVTSVVSPCGTEAHAFRGRKGNQRLMGSRRLGLLRIMRCWESCPLWILWGWWDQSANCQGQ